MTKTVKTMYEGTSIAQNRKVSFLIYYDYFLSWLCKVQVRRNSKTGDTVIWYLYLYQ